MYGPQGNLRTIVDIEDVMKCIKKIAEENAQKSPEKIIYTLLEVLLIAV